MAASTSRHSMSSSCCIKHPDAVLIEGFNAGDHICTECGVIVSDRVIGTLSHQNETDKEEQSLNTTMTKSKLAHINARQDINIMAEWINLPRTIADRASNLFQQAHGNKNLRGRTNEAITAACLYIACRQEGAPRTIREISAVSSVSIKDIGRCFKIILRELETSLNLSTCDDFMSRFCTNLGLSEEVQRAATHIARRAVDLDIVSGKSPISIAAAAIYMASQASVDKRTLKEIGEIVGIKSPVTYYLMIPHAHKLFPEDFQFDTPIKDLPRKQLPRISVPRDPLPTSQPKNSVHPSKKYVLVDMYYTSLNTPAPIYK